MPPHPHHLLRLFSWHTPATPITTATTIRTTICTTIRTINMARRSWRPLVRGRCAAKTRCVSASNISTIDNNIQSGIVMSLVAFGRVVVATQCLFLQYFPPIPKYFTRCCLNGRFHCRIQRTGAYRRGGSQRKRLLHKSLCGFVGQWGSGHCCL